MKITWLGQAGLLFDTGDCRVMVDPYLSDSVGITQPEKHRRQPVDEGIFNIKPDVMIFTHNHLDHYNPETVRRFISEQSSITVLAPRSVWEDVRLIGGKNNFVLFERGTQWTECGLQFTAVMAAHSDECAIGVIIEQGGRRYYLTGDTLYNDGIFADLPGDIYAVFLPINGVGNNMNMADAARFARRVGAERVVPLHFGMFDDIDPREFICDNRVIPAIYKEIEL